LGALGLIIGTFGLAVVLVRSIQERKQEMAVMRAVGISKNTIITLLVNEFTFLLIIGILIGGISSLLAVFPGLTAPGSDIKFLPLAGLVGLLLVNGLFWIILFARISGQRKELVSVLRND